jgi:hypothetical protein
VRYSVRCTLFDAVRGTEYTFRQLAHSRKLAVHSCPRVASAMDTNESHCFALTVTARCARLVRH